MIDLNLKTLIILPHLDDEFTLAPILSKINKKNLKIIYCSERCGSSYRKILRRRRDNLRSLGFFKVDIKNITYLNDYFVVEDSKLFESSLKIYKFLDKFIKKEFFPQVLTLNFEGGHPDHDQIALIVNKLNKNYKFQAFYFPAYNSRKTFFLPYSALRPLKAQESSSLFMEFKNFCWLINLKLALVYSTEKSAFILLMPFLIYKSLFSKKIIFFDHINISKVNWKNSLSLTRYKVEFHKLSWNN
tara:strand:+ start:552 stop:1283 length:732 start_codon:yes stop_codon:yes gene_type:complete